MKHFKINHKCSIKHSLGILCGFMLFFLLFMPAFAFTGCGSSKSDQGTVQEKVPYITRTDFLLNTVVTVNLYDKQDEAILDGCFDLISKYENIYSANSETSELYKLNNRTLPVKDEAYLISDELSDLLKYALYYSKLSGGVFDLSVWPLTSQWDFLSESPAVPEAAAIEAALPYVSYEYITLNGNEISFAKDKVGIDLGAIAKGYIADRLKDYLLSNGVNSAMINLGGNVLCVGRKPDGSPFRVGIQKPFADRNETMAVMDIDGLSVVSSGVYERFFMADGKLYHHILDPATGYPYDNGLISVTIISEKSVDGDGLSTTCFALGLEEGLALIESLPDTYAVFITEDYQVYYSKGFKEAIPVTEQQ
jgi:thiamine biosynthesis lipoprotein